MNKRIKRIISVLVCVSLMMVALPVEFYGVHRSKY